MSRRSARTASSGSPRVSGAARSPKRFAGSTTPDVGIADVAVRRPTLDDVFLQLTGRPAEEEAGAGAGARGEGGGMTRLAYAVSDTLVLTRRNALRIPRQPDLLISFTVQPIMFVLLFVYVFGGAIKTPGYDYVDFLMPGIIVQTMAFGGFVTALGLVRRPAQGPDRPLPVAADVARGRARGPDAGRRRHQRGLARRHARRGADRRLRVLGPVPRVVAGVALLLLFGYAFSWLFAFVRADRVLAGVRAGDRASSWSSR